MKRCHRKSECCGDVTRCWALTGVCISHRVPLGGVRASAHWACRLHSDRPAGCGHRAEPWRLAWRRWRCRCAGGPLQKTQHTHTHREREFKYVISFFLFYFLICFTFFLFFCLFCDFSTTKCKHMTPNLLVCWTNRFELVLGLKNKQSLFRWYVDWIGFEIGFYRYFSVFPGDASVIQPFKSPPSWTFKMQSNK